MQLVQQHIVNRNHPYWSYFDQQCFLSKNLFNLANYHMRQHFFGTRRVMSFTALYHLVSKSQAYYLLPNTKVAKQVTRRVHKTWLGYKAAHKDWQKHPEKYMGEPRIPKYKDKTKGRYMLVFPLETVSKPPLRKGIVKLTPYPIQFSSGLLNVAEVRVVPKSGCYVVEIVYEKEEANVVSGDAVAGVDLGLVNLVTLTTNQPGVAPLLIKGGALKAINTYYNKRKAKLQGDLETRHSGKVSSLLDALTQKRNNRVNNYLHTTSRRIYKSELGLLNADVNGSYNIIRKVKSNAFDGYDLKALPFMPSVLDPLRTHDFLQVA